MILGDRLKELRTENNLTGEELGKKFNVTKVAISNWESGKRYPDLETLLNIAIFFDVSVDYLLGKTNVKNEQNTSLNLTAKQLKALDLASKYSDEEFENIVKGLELLNIKKGT